MNQIRCPKCFYTVILPEGIDVLKLRFKCPVCGKEAIIGEIV